MYIMFLLKSHSFKHILRNVFVTTQQSITLTKQLSTTVSNSNKKNICIVGSGPAALYTTQYLLRSLTNVEKSIDIYEKLPVPFGLVRYGVNNLDIKN